jgi:hypothetical protein
MPVFHETTHKILSLHEYFAKTSVGARGVVADYHWFSSKGCLARALPKRVLCTQSRNGPNWGDVYIHEGFTAYTFRTGVHPAVSRKFQAVKTNSWR